MAYRITKECTACGICINLCVNRAVYVNANDEYAIDPEQCTECVDLGRRRCHLVCTVGAIQPDPARRESQEQLWAKYRALHTLPAIR